MSESMTVEQAISFVRVVREVPELKSSPSRSLEACMVLADKVERLQSRVYELEAEKWNAQIAEGALASVEQERDELRRRVAELIHYPDCWDQICYPTIERALENIDHQYQGCTECAEKSKVRIKSDAVREAAKLFPESPFVDCDNVRNDLLEYANQIEGGE